MIDTDSLQTAIIAMVIIIGIAVFVATWAIATMFRRPER